MSQTKAQLIEGSAASELTAAKTLLGAGSAGAPSLTATGDTNTGIFFPTADTIAFAEGGAEALRVDSSGRLLVGTSTARSNFNNVTDNSGPLQIEGTNNLTRFCSFVLNTTNAAGPHYVLGKSRGSAVGSNTLVQNGDEIGTLSFQGSDGSEFVAGANIAAFVDGTPGANDMPGRLVFSTTADGASSPTERMRVTNSGEILINRTGTTNSYRVGIEASASQDGIFFRMNTNGRNACGFSNSGGSIVGTIVPGVSSTAYNTSSDYRLKENVVDLDGAIDRLKLLPVHRFNFIVDPDTVVDGFIAHEAQEVVPECVTGTKDEVDDDGNPVYQGIDQAKLVPLLTAALQEAIAKIEQLEAAVTALQQS